MHPLNMKLRQAGLASIVCLALAVFAVPTLHADWIVMRDGNRISTKGKWKVSNDQILFKMANGVLSALPLDNVDLEASQRLSGKSSYGPLTKELETPRLVYRPSQLASHRPATAGQTEKNPVTVEKWQRVDDPAAELSTVVGILKNQELNRASDIQVSLELYGPEKQLVASVPAELSADQLAGGDRANFRADLPKAVSYESAQFDIRTIDASGTATAAKEPALGL